ncbi:MAG: hypothetical protein PHW34_16900 [Hespellia sp.]|nr:hypothetical protein [Hespellia sp.]
MKQGTFMKILIILCIAAVILYTITAIVFQYKTGSELSMQLTIGWFGFFGVELINMVYLKKEKMKN